MAIWNEPKSNYVASDEVTPDIFNELAENEKYLKETQDTKITSSEVKDATINNTQSSTRTNLTATEKLKTGFGKIRKWFADLKALAFKDTVGNSDIIVDSIYDMYANSYVQDLYAIATRELNSSRKLKRACEMNNIFIEDDYLKQYEYQKNYIFENRSKFAGRLNILEKNNIIGTEQKETIKILHTFRNVYLHQSKQKESYLNAVVSTYMYLLGKLFEAIPINKYCSVEDDCKYVENNTHILERDQRKKFLDYFFNQNSFIYSLLSCAKDLKSFIQEKIASVEDFIFNVFGEGKSEFVFNI